MPILSDIPVALDLESLLKQLHVEPDGDDAATVARLVDLARDVARPKAMFSEAYVEEKGVDTVRVGGVVFTSRLLRLKLEPVARVFPFVATCGREMDAVDLPEEEFMAEFWWDAIKAAVLNGAVRRLTDHLDRRYFPSGSASAAPGSGDVDVWPIQQQELLFSLLGDVRGEIGVELTPSCLMIPNKSVSGIRFASQSDFRTCQVCRRENCPRRRAPLDPELWEAIHGGGGEPHPVLAR